MEQETREFFDDLRPDYGAAILRCVPRYEEMIAMLLAYIPPSDSVRRILELGCGEGNLTNELLQRFPDAQIDAVDFSAEMLAACERRLGTSRVTYHRQDFRQLELPLDAFDVVASAISIHHLSESERVNLFSRLRRNLKPGGLLTFADQMSGETEQIYQQHMALWREHCLSNGASEGEWDMWMNHQAEHDHHAPLARHFEWLRSAGFTEVDCPWRHLLWTVMTARSP